MQRLCVPFCALVAAGPARAEEPERPKLVIPALVAERGIDDSLVRLLNELLLSEFEDSNRYQVVGQSDIEALLSNEQQSQLLGCTDTGCLAEIGGALGADFLANANIGRIGDYFLLNVKILDVATAKVVARKSMQIEGIENKLMEAVRLSVADVIGRSDSAGEPLPDAEQMPVVVRPGVTEPEPAKFGFWPWIAVGVAVAAGATATTLGVMTRNVLDVSPSDPDYRDAKSTAESLALGANVSFGVAGAAGIAAVVLFILDVASTTEHPVEPVVSSEGAALQFRF